MRDANVHFDDKNVYGQVVNLILKEEYENNNQTSLTNVSP